MNSTIRACGYRRVVVGREAVEFRCLLAQRILGLHSSEDCAVPEAACTRCGLAPAPSPARPNHVVASVVYDIATRLDAPSGRVDGRHAELWQARRYVLPMLAGADSLGGRSEMDPAPESTPPGWPPLVRLLRLRSARGLPGPMCRGRRSRIGLVGESTASGLGYLNRELARNGPIDRWIVVESPSRPSGPLPVMRCAVRRLRVDPPRAESRRSVRGLDWLIVAQGPPPPGLIEAARRSGVRVALIPMWEWTSPTASWLRSVDTVICPNRFAFRMFEGWRSRFGFRWSVDRVSWPVAADAEGYRQRSRFSRAVFVNGFGGARIRGLDGTVTELRRKGLDLVLELARRTPEIPWIIYSQAGGVRNPPPNVLVRPAVAEPRDLYREGDVCVQLSRWEGLGLPLLECQAAGLPLVTIDAPPMHEYRPWRTVPVRGWSLGCLAEAQPVAVPSVDLHAAAAILREAFETDISLASQEAHRYIRKHHSWPVACAKLDSLLRPR